MIDARSTIPTRRPLLRRLADTLRGAYLRQLIRAAEMDALRHEWHATIEPRLATVARQRAAELRVQLARLA